MITDLGGKFKETMEFVPECTHVISAKPIRSEKFLCGCASGKWVLTPKYICDSFSIRRWLDEEHYEWTTAPTMKASNGILSAPKRWRLFVQKECKGPFADWTVLIMVENKYRRPFVYKRLIEAGGGKTVSLPQGCSKNKEMFVDCVTHVIVDRCYANDVQLFARGGVPCLHPEYLAEYLFKTDAQMESYLVTSHVKRRKTSNEGTSCHHGSQQVNNTKDKAAISKQVEAKTELKEPLAPSTTPNVVTKRKFQAMKGLDEALESRKRQKTERYKPCVPPWIKSVYKTYKSKGTPMPVPFSQLQLNFIEATIEENQWFDGLRTVQSYLSPQHYPPAELLHHLMQQMLKTKDKNLAIACEKVLQATLCMHNPSTNPEISKVYLDALLDGPKEIKALDRYLTATDLWDYLYHVIKLALHQNKTSHQPLGESVKTEDGEQREDDGGEIGDKSENAGLLLKFLVFQIEDDFTAWKNRKEYGLPSSSHGIMISKILWPGAKGPPLRITTVPFKQLMKVTMKALLKTSDSSLAPHQCVRPLLAMINMAAEYCIHKECDMSSSATELNLTGDKVTNFSSAVASQIIEAGIHEDVERLALLLTLLRPAWLKLKVVQAVLDRRHQSLLEEQEAERMRMMPLSLKKIVDYYLWMVPDFKKIIPPAPKKSISEEKSSGRTSVRPLGDSNIDKNNINDEKELIHKRKIAASINKRNMKGETQLHVACIKNHLDKLKQLLTVPGVNVNAEDNAGWTPLHEAANHGHISCVKELLDFKPKLDPSVKDISNKSINLLAAPSECGTTPLHDAVFNDRIDCARLLVQAGGEAVLSAKNNLGFTPVHMAKTDEMLAVLRPNISNSSDHNKENVADSKVKVKKEKSSTLVEGDTAHSSLRVPEHRYTDQLGPRHSRLQVISEQKCECYCLLAHHLLLSYIKVKELTQLKQEMLKCKTQELDRKDSLRKNLKTNAECIHSKEGDSPSSNSSQSSSVGESSRSYLDVEVIYDDMEIFSSLIKHVKLFGGHIETVGAWEHGLKDNKQCYKAIQKMKLVAKDEHRL